MITFTKKYEDLASEMATKHHASSSPRTLPPPTRQAVGDLVDQAKRILFPHADSHDYTDLGYHLESLMVTFDAALARQISLAIANQCDRDWKQSDLELKAEEVAMAFMHKLPEVQAALEADVEAAYKGDPSLECTMEAVLCYPGVQAVIAYRVANVLHEIGVPLLPRMITESAHSTTGIDIHPGATIGEGFFIDHGTGVVIGATSIIGRNVRLYQGVTLGAKSLKSDKDGIVPKGEPRHPILEDDVVIYSWASVLGRITVGQGSVVGGNVWVTRDVPAGSRVKQAKTISTGFSGGAGI
ncbi:MAG: serine acetyltransferase [Planctomycetota bacterium]|nr:serine acetyltransferase [Planctomycetota bacterium]